MASFLAGELALGLPISEYNSLPNTSLLMDTSISWSIGHNFNYVGSFYFACKSQNSSEIGEEA